MNLDDIEALIRKYLSAGLAVVVVLVAPAAADERTTGDDTTTTAPDRAADDVAEPAGEPDPFRALPADEPLTAEDDGVAGADDVDKAAEPDRAADPDLDTRGPADRSDPALDEAGDGHEDVDRADGDADDGAGATDVDPGTADPTADTTAAERFSWGAPVQEDDFTTGSGDWTVYDGPGHAGQGTRSADALTISDGVLVITGDAEGRTGGIAWGGGQQYGRWEGRVRAPASDPAYNALLLLWPDAGTAGGGEIDFMEMQDPTRQRTEFFVHHGRHDEQVTGQVEIDGTEWHNWAVEWSPDAITGYVDGQEWFRSTDPATLPPGPMHLCIQLDFFPEGTAAVAESRMEVDWVRQYTWDGAGASTTDPDDLSTTDPTAEDGAGDDGEAPTDSEHTSGKGDGSDSTETGSNPARRLFTWS